MVAKMTIPTPGVLGVPMDAPNIEEIVDLISQIDEQRLISTDLLGDAIESALSESGGTKEIGLFRTPDHVRQFMIGFRDVFDALFSISLINFSAHLTCPARHFVFFPFLVIQQTLFPTPVDYKENPVSHYNGFFGEIPTVFPFLLLPPLYLF
jgi:hypothetical protein